MKLTVFPSPCAICRKHLGSLTYSSRSLQFLITDCSFYFCILLISSDFPSCVPFLPDCPRPCFSIHLCVFKFHFIFLWLWMLQTTVVNLLVLLPIFDPFVRHNTLEFPLQNGVHLFMDPCTSVVSNLFCHWSLDQTEAFLTRSI